ncbi:MAG: hypothetical protein RL685_1473 [Pseudomonadota bacterium]|jgi:hypothetical protein
MKSSTTCISIMTLVLASACGASEEGNRTWSDVDGVDGAVDSEGVSVNVGLETIHQFEVEGTAYSFLRNGDDVMLNVQTSRTAPRIRVQTETGAEPSFLEIFHALQPGLEPNEVLVTAHRESAQLMGREDDAVLASFLQEVDAGVVEKTAADLIECRGIFMGIWGGGFGGGTPLVSTKESTAAGSTLQASTASAAQKFMAAGACNLAATVPRSVAFDKRVGAAGAWVEQVSGDIAVDQINYIVHPPSAQVVNLRSRMVDAANNGMQMVAARRQ